MCLHARPRNLKIQIRKNAQGIPLAIPCTKMTCAVLPLVSNFAKSVKNRRRAINRREVARMKRNPSPNYSLSIAVLENALRVTGMLRGTSGAAPAEPRLLPATPAPKPRPAPNDSIRHRTGEQFSSSRRFSQRSGVHGEVRQNLLHRAGPTIPRFNGQILQNLSKTAAEPQIGARWPA